MKDLKISIKLTLLIATAVIGLLIFGLVGNSMVNTVKVTGPIYENVVNTKDMDADIMPPDLYLVEARVDLYMLLDETDPANFKQLVDELKAQENAFLEKHDKWVKDAPSERVKGLLNGALYTEGKEWMRLVDNQVVPAKMRRDEKAVRAALPEVRMHFAAHEKAANELDKILQEDVVHQEADAKATIRSRTMILTAACFGVIAGILLFGIFTSRMITGSLSQTVDVLQTASTGDLRARVDIDSKDEAGLMGNALNHTLDRIGEAIRSINESAIQLAGASEEFSSTSQQITANSEETSAQARTVAAATEQVNANLQTIASSTEELATSVKDIAQNATEAAKVAGEAKRNTEQSNAIVTRLGESSLEIGKVIKVITSIAQKTDLLALNATVEAARAGEVGAGFAVVANEVKELARQTAQATEEISQKIEAIQSDAKDAVGAISSISNVINRVNEISISIATAVEEQSATTNEMARNTTEAAKGAGEVAQNISGVAQAAQDTSGSAMQSLEASNQLAKMAQQLRTLVEQFKVDSPSGGSRPGKRSSTSACSRGAASEHFDHAREEEFVAR